MRQLSATARTPVSATVPKELATTLARSAVSAAVVEVVPVVEATVIAEPPLGQCKSYICTSAMLTTY